MANDVQIRVGMQNTASPELQKLLGDANKTRSTFDKLKDSCFSLGGAFAGLSIGVIARELLDIGMKAQALANSFKAITGSTGGATVEMQFLRREADRLGLDLYASADAYKGLAAAAKGTALEGRATRDIFVAVSEAATVLGLSADTTQGALLALQQMVSKGTVAAEELRGQLGERLPGAFQLAAKAMGVTTAELGKMLEQGKIVAEDFLPKFAKALHEQYGKAVEDATDSAVANINRLKNSWDELKLSFAKSGAFDAMIAGIKGTTSSIKELDMTLGALKMQWGVWDQIGQEMIIKAKQGAVMATHAYNSEYQKEYDALQAQLEESRNRYRETYDEAYRLHRQLEREGTGGLHQGKLAPSAPSKGKPDDKALKAAAKLREDMLAEDVKAAERQYKLWQEGEKAGEDYNKAIFEATATQYEKDMKAADEWLQAQRNRLNDSARGYEEYQTRLTEAQAAADDMRGIAYHEDQMRQVEAWKGANEDKETITDQTYDRMKESMSDFLYSGITGELNNFKEIWEALWKSLARIAANALAKDLFAYMKEELKGLSGGGGGGGISLGSIVSGIGGFLGFGGVTGGGGTSYLDYGAAAGWSGASFASGGTISEPSWLVSQRTGMPWGQIAESGSETVSPFGKGSSGGTVINNYNYFHTQAWDAPGVDQFIKRNAGSFLSIVHQDLERPGGLRNSISKALS